MPNQFETAIKAMESVEKHLDENAKENRMLADRVMMLEQKGTGGFAAGEVSGRFASGGNALAGIASDAAVINFTNDRSVRSANYNLDGGLLALKAVVGTSGLVQPQRDARIGNNPQRPLSLFDVLPILPVASNSFEFNRLNGYTNGAAEQGAEGTAKANSPIPTALTSAAIATIAHWEKLSTQALNDAPALQQQVSSLLEYGVLAKAAGLIIAGDAPGQIIGLSTQATAFASSAGASLADAVGEAKTALDVAGWAPDLAIFHPADWFTITSAKDSTGKYIASGWVGGAEPTIWGMRVVTDPSVSLGNPLVLDSSQVAILDRQQARVEFARDGDDFTKNVLTALAEARLGLAVFSPSAIREVTATP